MANRTYRPNPQPSPVNMELLQQEVTVNNQNVGVSTDAGGVILTIFDSTTDGTLQSICDTHDGTQLTENQQIQQAAETAINNGKDYLRRQLVQASPNVTTIYNTLRTQVDANSYLQQMVDNQASIMSNGYAWGLDLANITTALDRQRYILVVQSVIALLT